MDLAWRYIITILVVFIGIPILVSLPSIIYNLIVEKKYKKKLKRICSEIESFDLLKKKQDYLFIASEFQIIKQDLIQNESNNLVVKNFDDVIRQKEKKEKKIYSVDLNSMIEKFDQ